MPIERYELEYHLSIWYNIKQWLYIIGASAHSEHVQVIGCDIKLGSVEKSIDLDKEGVPQKQTII
jgi:hypothetical protein